MVFGEALWPKHHPVHSHGTGGSKPTGQVRMTCTHKQQLHHFRRHILTILKRVLYTTLGHLSTYALLAFLSRKYTYYIPILCTLSKHTHTLATRRERWEGERDITIGNLGSGRRRKVEWGHSQVFLGPHPPGSSGGPGPGRGTENGGGRPRTVLEDRVSSSTPGSSVSGTPGGSPATGTSRPGQH